MTYNSSVDFKVTLFQLWNKGSDQNPNFETFKCYGENLLYSSSQFQFHVIFQTTSQLKAMLDKSVNNVLGEEM